MSTFILFGNYSAEAFKGVSSERTAKSHDLAKKYPKKLEGLKAAWNQYADDVGVVKAAGSIVP